MQSAEEISMNNFVYLVLFMQRICAKEFFSKNFTSKNSVFNICVSTQLISLLLSQGKNPVGNISCQS